MLWYSVEAPRRGVSNEYLQHMFLCIEIRKNSMLDTHSCLDYGIRFIFLSHISLALKFLCGCVSGAEGMYTWS